MKNEKPIDVDAIVRKFEEDLANPDSDIHIFTTENAQQLAETEKAVADARAERRRRNFFRRTR